MSKKESILKTAVSLFAKRGFTATSTSSIAKKAGVAEGLIFHYFRNKEQILLHVLQEMTESYLQNSWHQTEKCSTGLEAVQALIEFHFQFSIENSEALVVLLRDVPNSFLQEGQQSNQTMKFGLERVITLLAKCIDRGKQDRTIRRDISSRETAFLLHGMLTGVSRLQLLGPIEVPDLRDQIMDFCLQAITWTDEK